MSPGMICEVVDNTHQDCLFEGTGRDAPTRRVGAAGDQSVGDVIAEAFASASCMRWRQQITCLIAELSFQRRRACA